MNKIEQRKKFLIHKGRAILITKKWEDDLWRDSYGTVFALREGEDSSIDSVDRCGVWIFSLKETSEMSKACTPHDFAYSSRAYPSFPYQKGSRLIFKEPN